MLGAVCLANTSIAGGVKIRQLVAYGFSHHRISYTILGQTFILQPTAIGLLYSIAASQIIWKVYGQNTTDNESAHYSM